MNDRAEAERYVRICQTKFWQDIFRLETEYLLKQLKGKDHILSVGCGPAVIEKTLSERGFKITGLDVSREALNRAPDKIRTVAARAEDMPFQKSSFDAVIYVASLQFIKNYKKAIDKTSHVLRPRGLLILMLLNTESEFVREKMRDPVSYMRTIKHNDLREIETAVSENYDITTEYRIGVKGNRVFESCEKASAVLYIIKGRRKKKQKDA